MIPTLSHILQLTDFAEQQRSMVKFVTELHTLSATEQSEILQALHAFCAQQEETNREAACQVAGLIIGRMTQLEMQKPLSWTNEQLQQIGYLYDQAPASSNLRNQLLGLLATLGSQVALNLWEDRVCQDPPQHRSGIILAFAPLMEHRAELTQPLFDKLLTRAFSHLPVAAAVLDLANFAFRSGLLVPHPAASRAEQLTVLLGELAGQMARIEEGSIPENWEPLQISQTVSDAVALIIPICDALALMEHEAAIGKLNQVLDLKHRRLQTEAAAALAKLEDERGRQALIDLAEHPSVRTRVLAYADELGLGSQISLEYQGDIATAEAHLATWLAEPEQMGIAPSEMKLRDNRELNWPSYEHPVQCYLFEYRYGSGDQAYRNLGISGPLTHAFSADLTHLSRLDTYAAFAGWQTTHQEVFAVPIDRARQAMPGVVAKLEQQVDTEQYSEIEPLALAGFFGEYQLVVSARPAGTDETGTGTLVVGSDRSDWIESGNRAAPIDWTVALDIWRGRRLLVNFNSAEQFE
ncbi:MAG: hypothetical protein VYE64_00550 [Planctomycetota bacterium]|nr:hypothetical protein [Planctomycetota bacterium]